jgi:hypothetical protein
VNKKFFVIFLLLNSIFLYGNFAFSNNIFLWLTFFFSLISVVLVFSDIPIADSILPFPQPWRGEGQGGDRFVIAVAFLVILLGIVLRVYHYQEIPIGIRVEKVNTCANACRIASMDVQSPLGALPLNLRWPNWVQTYNLYNYFTAIVNEVFGAGVLKLRMLSIVPGVLTLLAFFWLLTECLTGWQAVFGTTLLALSRFHLIHSRFDWDATMMAFLGVMTVACVLRGLRLRKCLWICLGGIALGISQHTYLASRLILLGFVVWLFMNTLFALLLRRNLKSWLLVSFSFLLACTVAAGPVINYHLVEPDKAMSRVNQLDIRKDKKIEADEKIERIVSGIKKSAEMFFVKSHNPARRQIPEETVVPRLVSILMCIGILLVALKLHYPGAQLILLLLGTTFLGGLLTYDSGPNTHRISFVIPLIYVLATISFSYSRQWFKRSVVVIGGLLIIGGVAAPDAYSYFSRFPSEKHYQNMSHSGVVVLSEKILEYQHSHEILISEALNQYELRALFCDGSIDVDDNSVPYHTKHYGAFAFSQLTEMLRVSSAKPRMVFVSRNEARHPFFAGRVKILKDNFGKGGFGQVEIP